MEIEVRIQKSISSLGRYKRRILFDRDENDKAVTPIVDEEHHILILLCLRDPKMSE